MSKIALAPYNRLLQNMVFLTGGVLLFAFLFWKFNSLDLSLIIIIFLMALGFLFYFYINYKQFRHAKFDQQGLFVIQNKYEDLWRFSEIVLVNRTTERLVLLGLSYRKFKIVHSKGDTFYFYATHPQKFADFLK